MYVVDEAEDGAMEVTTENGIPVLDGIYVGPNTDITTDASGAAGSETGVAEGTGAVTVDLTTVGGSTGGAESATLNLTQTAAASLANAPSLTVQTDVGSVKLDAAALSRLRRQTAPGVREDGGTF